MKLNNRVVVAVALVFALLCACSHGQKADVNRTTSPVLERILKRGELIVGTAASMPPLNMTNKDGEIIGFEADLAQYLAAGMGVRLKLEAMPFHELLQALDAGKVDMILSGMTMTPQRNMKVAFVGPYFLSGKSILTKAGTIERVKDASELNQADRTFVALRGSTSQLFVEHVIPKARLVAAENYDEAVDMVRRGSVDALVADHPICVVSALRYPGEGLSFLISPLTYEPIGIAVPGNDPLLVNWAENFLNTLKGSGKLQKLKDRWVEDASWLEELK
jgi:polar amino acid transport system substrate-binding protein